MPYTHAPARVVRIHQLRGTWVYVARASDRLPPAYTNVGRSRSIHTRSEPRRCRRLSGRRYSEFVTARCASRLPASGYIYIYIYLHGCLRSNTPLTALGQVRGRRLACSYQQKKWSLCPAGHAYGLCPAGHAYASAASIINIMRQLRWRDRSYGISSSGFSDESCETFLERPAPAPINQF